MTNDVGNDEICAECDNRLRCLVDLDLATDIVVDDFQLRPGCWVATTGLRRVQIRNNVFGPHAFDPDANSFVDLQRIEFKRRIPAPENDLRCPYCGTVVYHLLPHLEKCNMFKRRK